ncbi:MAG TPA: NUDIX hydrolase [Patescibacteria group bacterium]|nr:NUDIX hydrolase [Patescibacteria group bacterium]
MHHIQKKILQNLLYASELNYAKLRPAGIESNHFAYHLEQLMRDGMVAKKGKTYALTPQGLQLVDRLSQGKMAERLQPHIVTAINLQNSLGQTLLYERGFQPYLGRCGFPLGKIHYEENIKEAAIRELHEKTGITNAILNHRGVVYLESKIQGLTISKVMYHIFDGQSQAQPIDPDPTRGKSFWADTGQLPDYRFMPGFLAIKKLLAETKSGLFFAEICEEISV